MPRNKKRKTAKPRKFPKKAPRTYYDPGRKPKDSKPPTQVK